MNIYILIHTGHILHFNTNNKFLHDNVHFPIVAQRKIYIYLYFPLVRQDKILLTAYNINLPEVFNFSWCNSASIYFCINIFKENNLIKNLCNDIPSLNGW